MNRPLLFFLIVVVTTSTPIRGQPKIGLTLSGGGAKGLAHIGILEAIDSAGLRIDAITGTSMGGIVGSLYAIGYSGKEIEAIARDLDWTILFSGKPSMRNVNIDEKTEFDNYAIELPFDKGKFVIVSGIIEGQELWLKFQELFLPIYDIKDFSKFSIPFKCIATDISTGKAVVLDQGELVSAIRASMSIPSVFTPIDYKDTKLVDGGVVRNFPVRDVQAMGSDFLIGVNLSQGLLDAKQLNSAIDILYQIGFYKDADDFQEERDLCDILIEPPVADYSAASFSSADSILAIGKRVGDYYYPIFKKMADSLRNIYPDYKPISNRLPQTRHVTLDSITIAGLNHTTRTSFKNRLALEPGKTYDGLQVGAAIRRVYGSRNFTRIAYEWHPKESPGHANLLFNVVERPLAHVRAGIHYHTFSKIALILGVETKNLFFDRSKFTAKINLSENFRIHFEQNQAFGKRDNNNLILSAYYESFQLPVYDDSYSEVYLYRNNTANFDVKLQHTFGFSSALGVGTRFENYRVKPNITPGLALEAANTYLETFGYYKLNTLNRRNFTTRGWHVEGRLGVVYDQHPTAIKVTDGVGEAAVDTTLSSFVRLQVKMENFAPLSSKLTFLTQFNTAVNINDEDGYFNFYNIGGINDFLRNQIPFAGLPEYSVNTHSVSIMMIGFQYQLAKNLYSTLRLNAAVYDYLDGDQNFSFTEYLTGAALTLGFDSGIGPISVSTMYCTEADKLYGYVNLGFPFR